MAADGDRRRGFLRPLSVAHVLGGVALFHFPSIASAATIRVPFPYTPDQLPNVPYLPPPSGTAIHLQDGRTTDNSNAFAHHPRRETNPDPDSVVSCGSCCFPPPLPLNSSPFVDENSPYRSDMLRDGFFGKVIDVGGVPVVSSNDVSDAALFEAALTLTKMSSLNPSLLRILADEVVHVAIIGKSEKLTDVPRYSFLSDDPNTNWDAYRGVGATRWVPATSCAEENLLCLERDRYGAENICVHETAHTLSGSGGKLETSRRIDFGNNQGEDGSPRLEDLDTKLSGLYAESVLRDGLWSNTYAAHNHEELWAEGIQSYYSVNNPYGPAGGDGVHNRVWNREALAGYDPEFVKVVERVFPADVGFGCPPTSLDRCDCDRIRAVCDRTLGVDAEASLDVFQSASNTPTLHPTLDPTIEPSSRPSEDVTTGSSAEPTSSPSRAPTELPSALPTFRPSLDPSFDPSAQPTDIPTDSPSATPTSWPSGSPSYLPSGGPSSLPPSSSPSSNPSLDPSARPTVIPSVSPTSQPSRSPSSGPSTLPSVSPSQPPSEEPSSVPTRLPSDAPSSSPRPTKSAVPSGEPTLSPSSHPSDSPSKTASQVPSASPVPSGEPSLSPSSRPSNPPSKAPSQDPSASPVPSGEPSLMPSSHPSDSPSKTPSQDPSASSVPSAEPSLMPSSNPSKSPSKTPSQDPSASPAPSDEPSSNPTSPPSSQPSNRPSDYPTLQPSLLPSQYPSSSPSQGPSLFPFNFDLSGHSVIVEDVPLQIGQNITWTVINDARDDTVSEVNITGFPPGAVVSYADVNGIDTDITNNSDEVFTISFTNATEEEIRAAVNSITLTAPPESDLDFNLTVTVVDSTSLVGAYVHSVFVQAVADAPIVTAYPMTLFEDTTATLNFTAGHSSDKEDNSETLSLVLTVPPDGDSLIGTLNASLSVNSNVTFTDLGDGKYIINATGIDPSTREASLNEFLASGIAFHPREHLSGSFEGAEGIKIEAISTEDANGYGVDLAPNDSATDGTENDNDTKIESAVTYIDVTIDPVTDLSSLLNNHTIAQPLPVQCFRFIKRTDCPRESCTWNRMQAPKCQEK